MRATVTSRIAICLVCLLVSALLIADLLGIMPNPRAAALDGRRALCETLAINCSLLAAEGQLKKVQANLEATVSRHENILSAALRRTDRKLLVEVGEHAAYWDQATDAKSNGDNIVVPITAGDHPWGMVEVRFRPLGHRILFGLFDPSSLLFIGFVALFSYLAFCFFLRRALAQLDPSKVVPERVRAALDTLAEGLLLLDKNDRIVLANQAFADTVGQTPDELQGRSASKLPWAAHHDGPSLEHLPWQRARKDNAAQAGVPLELRAADGRQRTFIVNSAPIKGGNGKSRGVLASFDDVTTLEAKRVELVEMLETLQKSRQEIQRQNKKLQILATRDPLTGCLNRRAFFGKFEEQWSAASRYKQPLSCIMVDVDHFKSINDKYGHSVGDMVLKKVGAALRETARDTDVVCRYGGEEFCVLLPHIGDADGMLAAERIRKAIADLKFFDFSVTTSVGVSAASLGAEDPQQLLDQADRALYHAKETGRNRSVLWEQSLEGVGGKRPKGVRKPPPEREVADMAIPFHAVTALVSALAYRDVETAAHSNRVAELCVMTARGKLSVSDTYVLEVAALLHDIGKIGVPDAILLKPGPLTDEEWKEMSVHDRIGVEILRSSFACPQLAEIVESHHAFYGGKGRNEQLPTGGDIPLGARILAIADAYDAMVSDRVYRKGRAAEAAFQELRRCAGTQFDPQLVERFIAMVHQRNATSPRETTTETSKEAALQIGMQIEQVARALDAHDFSGLASLAGHLRATATHSRIPRISEVASELEKLAVDDPDMNALVSVVHELLDLCRETQRAYIDICGHTDKVAAAPADAKEVIDF